MSGLAGNPFLPDDDVVEATVFSADGSQMQTTEFLLSDIRDATRALAHEQRTANLIAYMEQAMNRPREVDTFAMRSEIFRRLGIGGAS